MFAEVSGSPSGRREIVVVSNAGGRKTSWHAWLRSGRNDCCLEKLKTNPDEGFLGAS